ncbi:MAG: PBP1A family penicillin-binding protein [Deltaproteobacteria bacterium]|nr:PBP1A family penicillin-binding protein [Deltaproteobacteria bacterium]
MTNIRTSKSKVIILIVVFSGILCGIIAGVFFGLTHDLPQIRALEDFKPSAVTRIYSADKVLLAEFFIEKRDPVPLNAIPHYLRTALIATEDRKFYKHSGVDIKGILRAIIKNIWAGEYIEGASTITQQLAKTLFLTPKKTIIRKMKEAVLSFQLERRYTKDEILKLYLNQVYFGSGAYGVESAARLFFGKPVNSLNLAECALIAGLPKSPSRYSPLVNVELALKRRNIVLKQMAVTGIITEADLKKAFKQPILPEESDFETVKGPYFVEHIRKFLEEIIGPTRLYKSGLTVFTTLSWPLQKAAEQSVKKGLFALDKRMKQNRMINPEPQCSLISLDIQSGGILAMVGGRDFYKSPFNRATVARRQPGSAFKPIVYAYAIEKGFPQNTLLLDAPVVFKGAREGEDWRPENFLDDFAGEMTFRKALTLSKNIPAARLIEMLGASSVSRFGHTLGIKTPLLPNLTLALGSSDVTLIDLTAAYSVFPNKGELINPYCILEVLDQNERVIWRVKPQKKVVMSRAGASIITNILKGVIEEGTGRKARILRHSVAGKTGTTDEFKDALFVGFSPSISTGVWVGQDDFTTLGDMETGAKAALPIWIAFMEKALADKPNQYFDLPDDVVQVRMDTTTGLLIHEDSNKGVKALFKKGTEPKRLK